MASHYDVLGVARDVGASDLRDSYLAAARSHHPDRNVGDPSGTEARFVKVQRAYDVLKNPQDRARYDAALSSTSGAAPVSLVKGADASSKAETPHQGRTVAVWASVTLSEMDPPDDGNDGDDGEPGYTCACRCGDYFEVLPADLERVRDPHRSVQLYLPCGGCSLQICLTVDASSLPPRRAAARGDGRLVDEGGPEQGRAATEASTGLPPRAESTPGNTEGAHGVESHLAALD